MLWPVLDSPIICEQDTEDAFRSPHTLIRLQSLVFPAVGRCILSIRPLLLVAGRLGNGGKIQKVCDYCSRLCTMSLDAIVRTDLYCVVFG